MKLSIKYEGKEYIAPPATMGLLYQWLRFSSDFPAGFNPMDHEDENTAQALQQVREMVIEAFTGSGLEVAQVYERLPINGTLAAFDNIQHFCMEGVVSSKDLKKK